MHKRYYLIIMLAHLTVPIALLFPVLKVDEIRLGLSGGTTTSAYYMNIFDYVYSDIYTLTGIFILFLAIIHIAGAIVAIIGFFSKSAKQKHVLLSFISGFSGATMAALQLYSGSQFLFVISAICFGLISLMSIKLMKLEEKAQK